MPLCNVVAIVFKITIANWPWDQNAQDYTLSIPWCRKVKPATPNELTSLSDSGKRVRPTHLQRER
ncbi:hypothetical protein CEQ28_020240 [Hafnia alvei]|nr:hypothetical protein CEQ28_020240 [Hafnia alvei]